MEEILATVAAVVPTVKGRPPHVDGMAVKPRAAIIELDAVAGADIDNVRKALAANPWLAARLEEIVSGEFRRRANGLVGGRLVLKFDTARPEPGQAVHLDQLDMQAFERVLRPHKLSFRFAGAVQKDANRKAGHITTAREYHLDKATLAQLRALLKDIPKAQPGLVPFEVRWKDDGRRIINKPILRVGGRAPAAP